MWYLVRKDISLVIRQVWFYLLLGLVFSAFSAVTNSAETITLTFMAVSVWNFATRILYLEEKNHTYGFLWTLPCPRSQFVISKYIAVLCFWLLSLGILAGASAVYPLLGLGTVNVFPLPEALIASSPFLVLISIYMFLIFRFGYIKAATHMRLLFVVCMLPVALPRQVTQKLLPPLAQFFASPAAEYLMPLAIVLVYLLSMGLSVAVFERKELNTLE